LQFQNPEKCQVISANMSVKAKCEQKERKVELIENLRAMKEMELAKRHFR
jgi:hypothetical protein